LKIIDLPNAPTRFTFPSNKILLKKIKAVLLPQTVITDVKSKKKTHIIAKSIHSSLRSESKNKFPALLKIIKKTKKKLPKI